MDVTLPDMWRASVRHAPVFGASGAQLLKKPRCGQRPASRMSRSPTDGWSPSSPGRVGRWHRPPGGWMWRGRRPRSMPGQPTRRRAGFTPRCQPIPPMAISTRATAILHADGMANAIVAATGRRLRDLPFALTETGTAGRAGRRHPCEPSPGLGQPESAPRPDLRAAMRRRAAKDIPPLTGRRAVVTVPGRLGDARSSEERYAADSRARPQHRPQALGNLGRTHVEQVFTVAQRGRFAGEGPVVVFSRPRRENALRVLLSRHGGAVRVDHLATARVRECKGCLSANLAHHQSALCPGSSAQVPGIRLHAVWAANQSVIRARLSRLAAHWPIARR